MPPPPAPECYPTSLVSVSNANFKGKPHPTAKPTALTDWLILTYSNAGDTVLDNTAGSFTTGVSALALGRNFIGIEKDPSFFEAGKARLAPLIPPVENRLAS